MRDDSLREGDQQRILKDRAQADTMQALTGTRPSLAATQSVDYQSDFRYLPNSSSFVMFLTLYSFLDIHVFITFHVLLNIFRL